MSLDLRERTFGKLTVTRRASEIWAEPILWVTFCACGTQDVFPETDLVSGEVNSCENCVIAT